MGNIAADRGASLASVRWTPFLDFIGREDASALAEGVYFYRLRSGANVTAKKLIIQR